MAVAKDIQKIVVLCAAVLVAVGAGAFLYFGESDGSREHTRSQETEEEVETEEEITSGEEIIEEETEQEIVSPAPVTQWETYTNDEWKFSFDYPESYTLTEELDGVKVTVSPPEGEFGGLSEWFMVRVVQYPSEELLDGRPLHEYLFYRGNLPSGGIAWLKDNKFYNYDDHFISREEISFGNNPEYPALKLRETSINPDLGEYRSIVYVLRDPVIYRVTYDLRAEETHEAVLKRVKDSFSVLNEV